MKEYLYRIYEVCEPDNSEFGNCKDKKEILMDVLVCDNKDEFKTIIKDMYGSDIGFKKTKKLEIGDKYCIIIGELSYNKGKYFSKIEYICDYCGSTVQSFIDNYHITLSESDIKYNLCNLQEEYSKHKFCTNHCKSQFLKFEKNKVEPDNNIEFFVTKDAFTLNGVIGYIYKITKKDSGEVYIGQSAYIPFFRWAQHLKTSRFPISNIIDYQFEVLEIVKNNQNILEVEKKYIIECVKNIGDKCLNETYNKIKDND